MLSKLQERGGLLQTETVFGGLVFSASGRSCFLYPGLAEGGGCVGTDPLKGRKPGAAWEVLLTWTLHC